MGDHDESDDRRLLRNALGDRLCFRHPAADRSVSGYWRSAATRTSARETGRRSAVGPASHGQLPLHGSARAIDARLDEGPGRVHEFRSQCDPGARRARAEDRGVDGELRSHTRLCELWRTRVLRGARTGIRQLQSRRERRDRQTCHRGLGGAERCE